MAPSPENDNAPKAPDKSDQPTEEQTEKDKDSVSNLNDDELKALLDEAISYRNPKDRVGKSPQFKELLIKAEEDERIARAASAGGSELVRHCNPSARRNGRHRRKQSSISENMMHGGSLDNLVNEEIFVAERQLSHTIKNVSARPRQGGSLPCNVFGVLGDGGGSGGGSTSFEYKFLEEAQKKAAESKLVNPDHSTIDMETESLLDHDFVAQNYQEQLSPIELVNSPNYTSNATFIVSGADGDRDRKLPMDKVGAVNTDSNLARSAFDLIQGGKVPHMEEKKVDENGNAVQMKSSKKKKDKDKGQKIIVMQAKDVVGHRSDIINDIHKLVKFIGGDTDGSTSSAVPSGKTRSNLHKSKQLYKQDTTEDGARTKKQRAHSSKGKEKRNELKKSNSLCELSTAKLDESMYVAGDADDAKVVMRANKNSGGERPRERRSWGNVEPPPLQSLYTNNTSMEALEVETREKWVVTKPKKKSKKRRSSSTSRRQTYTSSDCNTHHPHRTNRSPSPDLRGGSKSACSVPHSEKSNDSSDVDSVHSLPIDGLHNMPISYADIAKNKEKKLSPEKVPNKTEAAVPMATSVVAVVQQLFSTPEKPQVITNSVPVVALVNNVQNGGGVVAKVAPPDVHNIKSFPSISNNNNINNVCGKLATVVLPQPPPPPPPVQNNKMVNNNKNVVVVTATATTTTTTVSNNNKVNTNSNKSHVQVNSKNNIKATNVQKNQINASGMVQKAVVTNDIQTDLSIIQANEKDSIQFNAQMLPPDIPDVQTIEKMHFMTHHHQKQLAPSAILVNNHAKKEPPPPSGSSSLPAQDLEHQQQCQRHLPENSVNCDSRPRTTSSASVEEQQRPPPVVILSGAGNKDVSGLVFGFDVNEQLLSEGVCDSFMGRYMPPVNYTHASHNHDKIVNFVAAAWDDVMNEATSGRRVKYYSDGL